MKNLVMLIMLISSLSSQSMNINQITDDYINEQLDIHISTVKFMCSLESKEACNYAIENISLDTIKLAKILGIDSKVMIYKLKLRMGSN